MSRYLKLPAAEKQKILDDIAAQLEGDWTGDITFPIPTPPTVTEKPIVRFAPNVWKKVRAYIDSTESEIGWNGTVEREGNVFTITDVFLYPQTVTGVTVQTDFGVEEYGAYDRWVDGLDIDTYNKMRFHGHSHVNMAITPSTTDTDGYQKRVRNLEEGDYYIFMIGNKRDNQWWNIYDKVTGILYEEKDITVEVENDEFMAAIEAEKKQFLTYKTYSTYNSKSTVYGGSGAHHVSSPAVIEGSTTNASTTTDVVADGGEEFWLPESQSKFITKHNLKTTKVWRDVEKKGYVAVYKMLNGEKLSKKNQRRIKNIGGILLSETKPEPKIYGTDGWQGREDYSDPITVGREYTDGENDDDLDVTVVPPYAT